MPRARLVTRKDGLVEEHFAPSVNMSSYLVAFAVVDFKYKEKMTGSRVLVWLSLLFVEYSVCFIGGFPVRSFFLRRLFSSITKLRFRDWAVWTVRLIVEIKKSLQRSVDGASDDGRKNFMGREICLECALTAIFFFSRWLSGVVRNLSFTPRYLSYLGYFLLNPKFRNFRIFRFGHFFQGFLKIRKLINFRNANHPSEQNLLQFDEKNLMKRKFWARNFRKFEPNKKSAFP